VGFEGLTADDVEELRALVEEHGRRTDSPVATRVLAEWDGLLAAGAFVKVMPHDYKRVLEERAREQVAVAA
jgi:glutamate synthase domain-containing protein 3